MAGWSINQGQKPYAGFIPDVEAPRTTKKSQAPPFCPRYTIVGFTSAALRRAAHSRQTGRERGWGGGRL